MTPQTLFITISLAGCAIAAQAQMAPAPGLPSTGEVERMPTIYVTEILPRKKGDMRDERRAEKVQQRLAQAAPRTLTARAIVQAVDQLARLAQHRPASMDYGSDGSFDGSDDDRLF